MNNPSYKSFTLLELLIVIAVLAILTAVVLIVINPAEYLKKTRDARRITDLRSLNESLGLYLAEYGDTDMGSPNTVYISLPSDDSTCLSILKKQSKMVALTQQCMKF
ncbi:type II secretion system protein [bacterium]|nr:type II secretion system protein [bacterium]